MCVLGEHPYEIKIVGDGGLEGSHKMVEKESSSRMIDYCNVEKCQHH